jgi:hypothetical protein
MKRRFRPHPDRVFGSGGVGENHTLNQQRRNLITYTSTNLLPCAVLAN